MASLCIKKAVGNARNAQKWAILLNAKGKDGQLVVQEVPLCKLSFLGVCLLFNHIMVAVGGPMRRLALLRNICIRSTLYRDVVYGCMLTQYGPMYEGLRRRHGLVYARLQEDGWTNIVKS